MTAKALATTIGLLATILSLWRLIPKCFIESLQTPTKTMSNSANKTSLQISVENVESKPSTIRITVQNTDPENIVTILRWDSPLDKSAFRTGALTLVDAETQEPIEGLGMKLNRKLPPSPEDLVEIPPQGSASQEFELSEPWMPKGRLVKVRGQGQWKAIWPREKSAVEEEEERMLDASDLITGQFEVVQERSVLSTED